MLQKYWYDLICDFKLGFYINYINYIIKISNKVEETQIPITPEEYLALREPRQNELFAAAPALPGKFLFVIDSFSFVSDLFSLAQLEYKY